MTWNGCRIDRLLIYRFKFALVGYISKFGSTFNNIRVISGTWVFNIRLMT